VTYWALADMVSDALSDQSRTTNRRFALPSSHAALEEHNPRSRRSGFRGAPLAQLLRARRSRDARKAGSVRRVALFFERSPTPIPTVLAFEDMQWATRRCSTSSSTCSSGRGNHPVYVVTLAARSCRATAHLGGAGHRNFTSIYLSRCRPRRWRSPRRARPGTSGRAPRPDPHPARASRLYAVETCGCCSDRGLLVEEGSAYSVRR
jgi:hypothetical protein